MKINLWKRIISIQMIFIMILIQLSTVLLAVEWSTDLGTTVNLGVDIKHPNNYSYKVNDRIIYRTYLQNGSSKDFSKNIFCLDMNGLFPTESTSSTTGGTATYKSQGEVTSSTTVPLSSRTGGSLDQTKIKKIMAIMNKGYDYTSFQNTTFVNEWIKEKLQEYSEADDPIPDNLLSAEDVFILQQVAIWEITNGITTTQIKKTTTPTDSATWNPESSEQKRLAQAYMLDYFRDIAKNAEVNLPSSSSLASFASKDKVKTTTRINGFVYIGPFQINNSSNMKNVKVYGVTGDKETELSGYGVYDGNTYSSKSYGSIKNANGKAFYIRIESAQASAIEKLRIKTSSTSRKITWWKNESNASSQPLISFGEETKNDVDEAVIQKPTYDVALRKYITKINGTAVESRVPNVVLQSDPSAFNGNDFKYLHKKEPLEVKPGDNVTYAIQVYNECENSVKIKGIKDYLPQGLRLASTSSDWTEVTSPTDGSRYIFCANEISLNPVTVDDKGKHTTSSVIEVTCEVTDEVTNGEILTNVAEIMNVTDINDIVQKKGNNEEDSEGDNLSLATRKCPSDYSGKSGNTNLGQKDFYYFGEEDDDDFEKLRVKIDGSYTINLVKTDKTGTTITSGEAEFKINDETKPRVTVNGKLAIAEGKKIEDITKDDIYTIEETKSPEGYNKYNRKIKVTVKKESLGGKYQIKQVIITDEDGKEIPTEDVECIKEENLITIKVKNEKMADEEIDLALRKFIRTINGKEIEPIRDPNGKGNSIDTTGLGETKNTAIYNHPKNALSVNAGDIIVYTIKAYNEGNTDAYAREITDYIPEGLGYLPTYKLNVDNKWSVVEGSDVKSINYTELPGSLTSKIGTKLVPSDFYNSSIDGDETSLNNINIMLGKLKVKSTELEDRKIKAFDPEAELDADKLKYETLQVACVVLNVDTYKSALTETTLSNGKILKNIAAITKYGDKDNKEINKDRDSEANEIDVDSYPEDKNIQDDDDYEPVIFSENSFDLALKKFITTVKTPQSDGTYKEIDYSKRLERQNGDTLTSTNDGDYKLDKTTVKVKTGDTVVYTIRVYNEGEVNGTALKVADSLPEGLKFKAYSVNDEGKFISGSKLNFEYGWKLLVSGVGSWKTGLYTEYLKDKTINAYDKTTNKLSYMDIKLELEVVTNKPEEIKNIAEIIEDSNGNDRDSKPGNLEEIEDDEDYDVIIPQEFDLSLQKFITGVDEKVITDRKPTLTIDGGKIKYTHTTNPYIVKKGNKVTYTIRLYNEGQIAGFPSVVKDDLPEGITFLKDSEINKKYDWKMYRKVKEGEDKKELKIVKINEKEYVEVEEVKDAEIIATDYYSYEKAMARTEKAIAPYDSSKGLSDTNPDYRDLQVQFEVTESSVGGASKVIINTAEIADDQDEDGNEIKDKDSTPNNDVEEEDDIDKEYIQLKYFDLSLLKYVSSVEVTEDGKKKVTNTGYNGTENPEPIVKVEIHRKKLKTTKVKYTYSIKITNEGEIEGYAEKINDYIPKGLEFYEEDNKEYGWKKQEDGTVATEYLKDKLIKPGESQIIKIVLRWKNSSKNLGADSDDDIDSIPGNKKDGEDDIDEAIVILSIKTGGTQIYIILILTIISILSIGGLIIYKYVYRPQNENPLITKNKYRHKRK